MKATVLSIGINTYENGPKNLVNAVNDANSIGERLGRFGYSNFTFLDLTAAEILQQVREYAKIVNENQIDVAVFYFAGHGCEVVDEQGGHINCVLGKDSCCQDGSSLLHTSVPLQDIINAISETPANIKIFIIDACREHKTRSISQDILAKGFNTNISASKGTIIAFSTSSASTAMDGGGHDGHSVYTSALLDIMGENIQIEEMFKKVRGVVAEATDQTQIPWEFSSLIGNFKFNFDKPLGQEVDKFEERDDFGKLSQGQQFTNKYSQNVLADATYICNPNNTTDDIISKFRTHNWYKQNEAIMTLYGTPKVKVTHDQQFIIGRNILQSAIGGESECRSIINGHLAQFLNRWTTDGVNHMLNGMLYEMYFNNRGELRNNNQYKANYCDEIFAACNLEMYKLSLEFINEQLKAQNTILYYYPGSKGTLQIQIESKIEKETRFGKDFEHNILDKILIDGQNVLEQTDSADAFDRMYRTYTYAELEQRIQNELCAPRNVLSFVWFDMKRDVIEIPAIYNLIRLMPK